MITREVIDTLYKKNSKAPSSPDCLDMPLLFDYAAEHHNITIDMDGPVDFMVINSIDPDSLFHKIPLARIHAIVPFEEWIAIVLHSSIIFLSRKSPKSSIHIKPAKLSIIDRARIALEGKLDKNNSSLSGFITFFSLRYLNYFCNFAFESAGSRRGIPFDI